MNPEGERSAAEGATPKACPSCGKRYPADALFCSLDGAPLTTVPGAIAAAAATDPYVGREILGHIEIRQLVGIGAMGRVYRAFQRGIDRDVAVKILHRELSASPALVARFNREAKVASRLAHPHVVHVLLVGQLADGAMSIVMEYLDGMSLQGALGAAGGAMPLPRALHIALQLCEAAGEAHAEGIVHRDLKPENVMLVRRADDPDFVKVLDFGIARLNWDEPSSATAAGLIFGTARYISPEGAQGERVGPAGDVYSIATIVYQMLSGRTPFDADQTVALLVQQIHDPPRPLNLVERSAYVPEPVAEAIMQNLAKRPSDRAPDARALGRLFLDAAVRSGLRAQDILARPALLSGGRGAHASAVQMPSMQRTKQLTLDPEIAARMAAPPAPPPGVPAAVPVALQAAPDEASREPTGTPASAQVESLAGPDGRSVGSTAFETPADGAAPVPDRPPGTANEGRGPVRTEISDPAALPPTQDTTKWVPPADFEAKVARPLATRALSPDLTMDDVVAAPQPARAPLQTMFIARPPPSPGSLSPLPSPVSPQPPPIRGIPVFASLTPTPPPPSGPTTPLPPSRPPSSVETTLAGDPAPQAAAHVRLPALMAACFLLGVVGMSALVWKAGVFGRVVSRPISSDSPGSRAAAARPSAVEVVAETPATPLAHPTPAAEGSIVPPLVGAGARPAGASSPPAGPGRVTIDASNSHPGVGQPVDLAAHVAIAARAHLDGAHFRISGPGLDGATELPASDDGSGVFRSTFTFLQAGRFEVRFAARADGAIVGAARLLIVGESPSAPAGAAPSGSTPNPASTSPNAKWM